MKVVNVESAVLVVPTPRPMALEFPEHRLVVAHVHTDEGVSGLGYSLAFGGGGAEAIQVYLETRLAPLLVGQDPRLVERLWERMYRADRGIRRLGVAAYALSALDIALWDIVGNVAGQPLYRLWGGATDRVPAYGSGGWPAYRVEDLIEEAQRYVAQGLRHCLHADLGGQRRRRTPSRRPGCASGCHPFLPFAPVPEGKPLFAVRDGRSCISEHPRMGDEQDQDKRDLGRVAFRPPSFALRRAARALAGDRRAPPRAPAQAGQRSRTPGWRGQVGAIRLSSEMRARTTEPASR